MKLFFFMFFFILYTVDIIEDKEAIDLLSQLQEVQIVSDQKRDRFIDCVESSDSIAF